MDVSDARLLCVKRIAYNWMKFRDDKWNKVLDSEEAYALLLNFFEQPDMRHMYLFLDALEDIHLASAAPQIFKRQLIHFQKLPGQQKVLQSDARLLFSIDSKSLSELESKMFLLYRSIFWYIRYNLPNALQQSIESTFAQLRFSLKGTTIRLLMPEESFLAQLRPKHTAVPVLSLARAERQENAYETPYMLGQLEQYAISWAKSIAAEVLRSPCVSHCVEELQFWKEKMDNLHNMKADLHAQQAYQLLYQLEKRGSALVAVLYDREREIDQAMLLCYDACTFLLPLEPLFEKLDFGNMTQAAEIFITAVEIIKQRSELYGLERTRITQLSRCFFLNVVELVRDKLENANLLKMEAEDAVVRAAAAYRKIYYVLSLLSRADNDGTSAEHDGRNVLAALFNRLQDLQDLLQKWVSLAHLEKLEIGGINGRTAASQVEFIFQAFQNRLLKWYDPDYDPTDVESPAFDAVYAEFQLQYADWEKRLAGILSATLQQNTSLLFLNSVVQQFVDILPEAQLQVIIQANSKQLFEAFVRLFEAQQLEMHRHVCMKSSTAETQFLEGAKRHIISHYNIMAGLIDRCKAEPLALKLSSLQNAVDAFVKDVDDRLVAVYNEFLAENQIDELLDSHIFKITELKTDILQDEIEIERKPGLDAGYRIELNYSERIQSFFADMRYFYLSNLAMPDHVKQIYSNYAKFQYISTELSQQFYLYNNAQEYADFVIRPLLYKELAVIEVLKRYQPILRWNSPMAQIFELMQKIYPIRELDNKVTFLRQYGKAVEKQFRLLGSIRLFSKYKGMLNLEEIVNQIPGLFKQASEHVAKEVFAALNDLKRGISVESQEWDNFLLSQHRIFAVNVNQLCISYINRLMSNFDEAEQHSFCNMFNRQAVISEKASPVVEFVAKLWQKEIVVDPGTSEKEGKTSIEYMIRLVIRYITQLGDYIADPSDFVAECNKSKAKKFAVITYIDDSVTETVRRVRSYIEARCKMIANELSYLNEFGFLVALNKQLYFEYFLANGPNLAFDMEINEKKLGTTEVIVRSLKTDGNEQYIYTNATVNYYRKPELADFELMIKRFSELEDRIETVIPYYKRLGWASISFSLVKQQLHQYVGRFRMLFVKYLTAEASKKLESLSDLLEQAYSIFALVKPDDSRASSKKYLETEAYKPFSNDFEKLLKTYRQIKLLERQFSFSIYHAHDTGDILARFGESLSAYTTELLQSLPRQFVIVKYMASALQDFVYEGIATHSRYYQKQYENFATYVVALQELFEVQLKSAALSSQLTYQIIDEMKEKISIQLSEAKYLNEKLQLFGITQGDIIEFYTLNGLLNELTLIKQVRDVGDAVEAIFGSFEHVAFREVKMQELETYLKEISKVLRSEGRQIKKLEYYKHIDAEIRQIMKTVPILAALRSPAITAKHLAAIAQHTGKPFTSMTSLGDVLKMNIEQCEEDVLMIAAKAEKEQSVVYFVRDLQARWGTAKFDFVIQGDLTATILTEQSYYELTRGSHILMIISEELQDQLSTDLSALSAMLGNKLMQDFHQAFSDWQRKLVLVESLVSTWAQCQRVWSYLHPIFLNSVDIYQYLVEESAAFRKAHAEFTAEQKYAFYHPICAELAYSAFAQAYDRFFQTFQLLERSLAQYLERKRVLFPRFFFLSNADLLEVLSVSTQPRLIERHLAKLTDCQSSFLWAPQEAQSAQYTIAGAGAIIGCISTDGEVLRCAAGFPGFTADGPAERWLPYYLEFTRSILKRYLPDAVHQLFDAPKQSPAALEQFTRDFVLYAVLTAVQVHFTHEAQSALDLAAEGDEGTLRALLRQRSEDLAAYIRLIYSTQDRQQIGRLSTVCTVVVHTRDVALELIRQKAESPACFLWQRQLRFYYTDACEIRICDARLEYTYEFTGNAPRLVVTPLTDRCYITLTQALHLMLGGAPAGPAGTGKTETTKDLGKALGRMVYVFNCSPEMDYEVTQSIFYGLCTSGSWGCFDEFNRIDVSVLSVVAMQVKSVLDSVRSAHGRAVFKSNQEQPIDPNFGYFITMNPGYAGRTELPDNLKALFRGVAMVVPDFCQITEIMLISQGFASAKDLAKKFTTLYSLTEELLSKQDHYDWGLRAIIAICRAAGSLRRDMIK